MRLDILNDKLRLLSKIRSEYVRLGQGVVAACDGVCEVELSAPSELDVMLSSKSLAVIALEADDAVIEEREGRVWAGKTKLNTLKATFYEGLPEVNPTQTVTVNSELLKIAFLKTYYIANGEDNPLFDGIHWQSGVVISTDGKSISAFKLPSKWEESFTLPKQVVSLLNIFSQENVLVSTDNHLVSFKGKSGKITSRLLDGKFPNVMQYIQPVDKYVEAPRGVLFQTLRKCQAVQAIDTENLDTYLSFQGKELHITATGAIGEVRETIPLSDTMEGEHYFSTKALVNIFSNLRSDSTRLFFDRLLYISDSPEEIVLLLPVRRINT